MPAAALVLAVGTRANAADAGVPAAPVEAQSSWYLHGRADVRYTFQADSGEHDSDLRERFRLTFGEETRRRVTGEVAGFLAHDLDDTVYGDRFASLGDTSGRTYGQLSAAYVELRLEGVPIDAARVGRQWLEEVPELVRMDGARVESVDLEPYLRSRAVVFAGIPDHLSESSRRGDRVFGGTLSARPWRDAQLAATYARIHDVYDIEHLGESERVSRRDDYLRFSYRQYLLERRLSWRSDYSLLENEPRDLRLRASYQLPWGTTDVSGYFTWLFSRQDSLSTELDPCYSVLRSYYPYREGGVLLRHEFAPWLDAEGGITVRRLTDGSDVGPYNHEFERYWAAAALRQLPWPSSELVVTTNCYDTGSDWTWAVEGTYSQKLSEALKCELGSGYALWKEDRYSHEERVDVRSFFLRVAYAFGKAVTLDAEYALEDDEDATTHRVEVGVKVRF